MVNKVNKSKCKGRRDSIKTATPSWLLETDLLHTKRFYEIAVAMSEDGLKHEVDHIVPVNHPLVCGLHVPWNLQIITYDANKEKGNTIHTEPMPDAITYQHVIGNMSVRNKGLNAEVSGKRGRPPGTGKHQMAAEQQALMDAIFEEADGDAVLFQKLVLKNGSKLKLDLNTAMKLAKDLASYQTARKASIEQKTETVTSYVLSMPGLVNPQQIDNKTVDITPEPDVE